MGFREAYGRQATTSSSSSDTRIQKVQSKKKLKSKKIEELPVKKVEENPIKKTDELPVKKINEPPAKKIKIAQEKIPVIPPQISNQVCVFTFIKVNL